MSGPPIHNDLDAQRAAAYEDFVQLRRHMRDIGTTAGAMAALVRQVDAQSRPPTLEEMRTMLDSFAQLDGLMAELRTRVARAEPNRRLPP